MIGNAHYSYVNGSLYCEGVSLRKVAERCGTPTYVYSKATIHDRINKVFEAFPGARPHFAVKALANLSILHGIFQREFGADVVSGGELHTALLAGCDPAAIVFAGAAKTDEELEYAVKKGVTIVCEAVDELNVLNRIAVVSSFSV
jgi:diaminopimelate decarboxylase